MDTQTPTVIIGGSLNSLGVVRSLAAAGMPITVLEATQSCPAAWSRLCQFVRVESLEGRPLVDVLKTVAAQLGQRAVLIITDDRAVQTVSDFREEIEPRFRFSLPSKESVRTLLDKTLFQKFAEENELPVPRSIMLQGPEDFRALETLTPPLVIKPANKSLVPQSIPLIATRADTLEQTYAIAAGMIEAAGKVIVQEWIDGPDKNIFFTLFTCDSRSNITALFSGRKVLCHPPQVGMTAVCVAAGEASDELERMTRDFIALVNYRGIGSLEFKRDQRTGRFVIVEPTVGRTDWQEEIATLCGVNIPLATYRSELGQRARLPESNPQKNSKTAWRSSMKHRPSPGDLLPGTRLGGGYFRSNDPLPALYYYGYERFAGRAWNLVRRFALERR